jgi:hypothetical protein
VGCTARLLARGTEQEPLLSSYQGRCTRLGATNSQDPDHLAHDRGLSRAASPGDPQGSRGASSFPRLVRDNEDFSGEVVADRHGYPVVPDAHLDLTLHLGAVANGHAHARHQAFFSHRP